MSNWSNYPVKNCFSVDLGVNPMTLILNHFYISLLPFVFITSSAYHPFIFKSFDTVNYPTSVDFNTFKNLSSCNLKVCYRLPLNSLLAEYLNIHVLIHSSSFAKQGGSAFIYHDLKLKSNFQTFYVYLGFITHDSFLKSHFVYLFLVYLNGMRF